MKQFLLSRTGIALAHLINDLKAVIGDSERPLVDRSVLSLTYSASNPPGAMIIRFDGSFQLGSGAGVGVTIEQAESGTRLMEVALPVKTVDA